MSASNPPSSKNSLALFSDLLVAFGALAFGIALALYAFLGTFSRYYADDFCLTSGYLSSGFWSSQIDLYVSWSNRFSAAFAINLSELLGRWAVRGWTALVIILWVAALAWALIEICRTLRLPVSLGIALLLAETVVFFAILEAPQQYQSLYWRVGIVTYTLPLVFISFIVGLLFNRARKTAPDRLPWVGAGAGAVLAFVAGGFSETTVAQQTALFSLAFLAALLAGKSPLRNKWLLLLGAVLLGSIVSLAVVIASPGNAVRLAAIPTSRPPLFTFARISVVNAFLFMYISLKSNPFQVILSILIPLLAVYGYSVARAGSLPRLRPSSITLGLFLAPLAAYLLVLAACAPSAYAEASYPEGRAVMGAGFVMVVMAAALGILLGMGLSLLARLADEAAPALLLALTAVLFLGTAAYPLYDAYRTYRTIPAYQARAASWDSHDAEIRAELRNGVQNVNLHDPQARSFDSFSGLLDLSSDPKNWINQCAASYYGLHTLAVNQP